MYFNLASRSPLFYFLAIHYAEIMEDDVFFVAKWCFFKEID